MVILTVKDSQGTMQCHHDEKFKLVYMYTWALSY